MERAWALASIACMLAAGVLLILGRESAAFVVAALGAVAWFLSYRAKLRATIEEAPELDDEEEAYEEDVDDEDEK